MNSVGHMVKSGKLVRALHDLQEAMGTTLPGYNTPNVYSLDQGLELAMATINKASDGPSGKATFLIPLQPNDTERGGCPVELPKFLSGFDYSQYKGFYHTDFTLPSEYFRPDVTRPTNVEPYNLDFTYLFLKDLTNPDFDRMGEGRRIRLSGSDATGGINPTDKRIRAQATEVRIADVPRLREALELKH